MGAIGELGEALAATQHVHPGLQGCGPSEYYWGGTAVRCETRRLGLQGRQEVRPSTGWARREGVVWTWRWCHHAQAQVALVSFFGRAVQAKDMGLFSRVWNARRPTRMYACLGCAMERQSVTRPERAAPYLGQTKK